MPLWDALLESFASVLFALTHACGGSLGMAIITLSLIVRVALLPLTLRAARRAALVQRRVKALEPELSRLQQRFRDDPPRLIRERNALLRKNGVRPLRDSGIAVLFAQLPIMTALYTVIRDSVAGGGRFLWITSLARPDALLALGVAALAAWMAAWSPAFSSGNAQRATMVIPVLITLLIVLRLAAGVGLYWAVSNALGVVQAWVLRRDQRSAAQV